MAYRSVTVALSLALMAVPAAAQSAPAASVDETKYCIDLSGATGSRIKRIECRTKADWARLGVDIDEIAKK